MEQEPVSLGQARDEYAGKVFDMFNTMEGYLKEAVKGVGLEANQTDRRSHEL
jgi:hypothetical protein